MYLTNGRLTRIRCSRSSFTPSFCPTSRAAGTPWSPSRMTITTSIAQDRILVLRDGRAVDGDWRDVLVQRGRSEMPLTLSANAPLRTPTSESTPAPID